MSNDLMKLPEDVLSSLVLNGDVSKLNPTQKMQYYGELCKRVGIDPATQPFKLLKLQGKEVFYADKGATQQLSQKHNISHEILKRDQVKDVYIVTVRAKLADGRYTDEDGAVTIGADTGDKLANALMKATTKAKRRAVLALLGLGMMDESEVEEAWEEFKGQKDYIKEAYLDKERSKITAQVEEKRKALKGNSPIQDASTVYNEAKSGLDNFLDKIVNTKVEGVVITPKMALDLVKLTPKFFATSMKDGKVDVSDAFDTAFAKLAKSHWREDFVAQGVTQGLEKAFQEKHSPNATSMVSGQKKTEVTKESKEEEAWKARYMSNQNTLLTNK